MTTLLERVARALAHVDGHGDFLPGSVANGWHEPARAAIEAMRRPTERMAIAGKRTSLYPARTWAAMIDGALEEADERRAA